VVKPTNFKDDEILFHAVAPGGRSTAPDADYESAQSSDNIVENSGLASFDAPTLQKMLAGKEVDVSPSVTMLKQELDGHSTKKDLETLFQLTYLYMTAPRYDSSAAASWITRTKAEVQNMGKMPEMTYYDSLTCVMSQNNYRARPQSVELLNEINPVKAYDYYKTLYGDASGFTFFFVGNIDMKTLRPMVETYLASLPSTKHPTKWHDVGIRPPKGALVKNVYKGSEPKSLVTMIYTGHKKFSRENRFRLSAMAQAFQIKLQDDIREDKSGAYYVRVSPSFQKYPKDEYRITINFGCNPTRVDELVAEVRKQLDTLTTKPIEATYCERIHKIMTNELEVNLKENKYWMAELQDAFWNDLDPNSITESASMINSITPSAVFDAAKEYFDPANCVEVVLYPEKKS
jgi:zinc protease